METQIERTRSVQVATSHCFQPRVDNKTLSCILVYVEQELKHNFSFYIAGRLETTLWRCVTLYRAPLIGGPQVL